MAFCDWTLLNELWDALGTWNDLDTNGAVSSISPAGQLYLDLRALSANGHAKREKDIGTIGSGDFTFYVRFKGDVWDGTGTLGTSGLNFYVRAATNGVAVKVGNQADGSTDGIWVYDGAGYVKVHTKTWDNDWHTLRCDVHNSQTDVDIYIDDEAVPSVTDADCTFASGDPDGTVHARGLGTVAGNGEYHVDFFKVNAGICDPNEAAGPAGVKTINELAIASVKTIEELAIGSVKTIQGSAA